MPGAGYDISAAAAASSGAALSGAKGLTGGGGFGSTRGAGSIFFNTPSSGSEIIPGLPTGAILFVLALVALVWWWRRRKS
jgi:hypothetical protein